MQRTYNTMDKRKGTIRQTMVDIALHRKLSSMNYT